jgi:cysteinyl-tRNA synthetase
VTHDVKLEARVQAKVSLTVKVTNPRVDALVQQRKEAREAKDFRKADEIRTALALEGIVLEDKPDGTTEWRRVR